MRGVAKRLFNSIARITLFAMLMLFDDGSAEALSVAVIHVYALGVKLWGLGCFSMVRGFVGDSARILMAGFR